MTMHSVSVWLSRRPELVLGFLDKNFEGTSSRSVELGQLHVSQYCDLITGSTQDLVYNEFGQLK